MTATTPGTETEYQAAFDQGQFGEAFSIAQNRMIQQAFDWFVAEGVDFVRAGPQSNDELLIGLAMAGRKAVEALGGESASTRVHIAALVFEVVANLRRVTSRPPQPDVLPGDRLAEVMLHSAALGSIEAMMTLERQGHFDKLAEFELDRMSRRLGAARANAAKATVRERALGEALSITSTNAALSAEDLALKVRERLELPTTLRTIAEWIRVWRRQGSLPQRSGA